MFHIELRRFPNNTCHFNLTEQELYAIVLTRWARGEWVEVGERKWSPHEAKLTIIEGPEVEPEFLTMGRGWRHAQHEGRDVTARMIQEAEEHERTGESASGAALRPAEPATGARAAGGATPQDKELQLLADSLGLELLGAAGVGRCSLVRAWRMSVERHPERTLGENLMLTERAVRSLLGSRLIVLARGARAPDDGTGTVGEGELDGALGAVEGWTSEDGPASVWIHRA